jgi:hypothetical protein
MGWILIILGIIGMILSTVFAHVELKKQSELQRKKIAITFIVFSFVVLIVGVLTGGSARVRPSTGNLGKRLANIRAQTEVAKEIQVANAELNAVSK